MVILTFSYRSTKKEAFLRLRYRNGSTSIEIPTEIKVSKEFWRKHIKGAKFKGDNLGTQTLVSAETENLKKHVQAEIDRVDTYVIDKEWLKDIVHGYYNPSEPEQSEIIPHGLIGYWNYYLEQRGSELKEKKRSYQKWVTVRNKVEAFQEEAGKWYEIKDVDENFKSDFIEYCKAEKYSNYTVQKEFSYIKTICTNARAKGIEVSPELDTLKVRLKKNEPAKVYLAFDELSKIKKVKGLPDYLDNARDWLIISCYTGQRVSDFMRFDKSMIRKAKGKKFLDIKQVKTSKEVTIPILPEVQEILDKRNGEFPRPTSDVKYNVFIKEVCKRAGLTQKTKGSVTMNISEDDDKTEMRHVHGVYPKYKLISSHVGRRSFATNYYGKIPTTYLKNITAHGTEAVFLAYIGKTSKDTALEAYDLLLNAER